jgi:predicted O-methyltransferase YrrM
MQVGELEQAGHGAIFARMSRKTIALDDRLYDYLLAQGTREHPLLPEAQMQVAPEQGAFMQQLVALSGARRCVEVGVFTGYSSLAVALALPVDGRLLACDVSAEWTAIAQRHWAAAGVAQKIELVLAPALDTLNARLAAGGAGSYDLAFLDADKANYPSYAELLLALLRPGGLLVVDNVLWSGRVADPAVTDADTVAIRALNAQLHADPRVTHCIVPIADGIALAIKR